jgi:hypothetical protein
MHEMLVSLVNKILVLLSRGRQSKHLNPAFHFRGTRSVGLREYHRSAGSVYIVKQGRRLHSDELRDSCASLYVVRVVKEGYDGLDL